MAGRFNEARENLERLLADMVLDSLGIPLGDFFWEAKDAQERDNQAVAPSRRLGQTTPGFGQEDGSVRLVLE